MGEVDDQAKEQKQQDFLGLLFLILLDADIVIIDNILKWDGECQ